MRQPIDTTPEPVSAREWDAEFTWTVLLSAAREAERLEAACRSTAYEVDRQGSLRPATEPIGPHPFVWNPAAGWQPQVAVDEPSRSMLDLYLPICSATRRRPITVGHLGQSLDGFIATHAGESRWVTGRENLLHMHRLRALCDAVIVGAGTVAADDPQLTTRLVPGSSPLRVVIDPQRRLGEHHRLFTDAAAETLYVCLRALVGDGEERYGCATVVGLDGEDDRVDVTALMRLLRERGCARVFIEGGGVTVSMFLEANLLDRLHMAVAPMLIGDGRPAIRFAPRGALGDCRRPPYRVFRMGGDILFDCDLASSDEAQEPSGSEPPISRII
jgi:riboflavin-specific deaminase-like protein